MLCLHRSRCPVNLVAPFGGIPSVWDLRASPPTWRCDDWRPTTGNFGRIASPFGHRTMIGSYGVSTKRPQPFSSTPPDEAAKGHPSNRDFSSQRDVEDDCVRHLLRSQQVRLWWEREKNLLLTLGMSSLEQAKPEPVASPRATGGAPPKHDWDAIWSEISKRTAAQDLEEEARSRLQKHMEKWTADHFADPPDPSTIRKRLALLYKSASARMTDPLRAAGGALPKFNLDAFWIAVAIQTAVWGLETQDRPRLQQHMEEWAAHRFRNPPDPSTIRKKLALLYKPTSAPN